LGLEVAQLTTDISVCQRKCCLDLIYDFGLLGCKPVSTPMDSSLQLHHNSGDLVTDVLTYRRLVGCLLYLTTTCPDISYPTQQLTQFMAQPRTQHLQAALTDLKIPKRMS